MAEQDPFTRLASIQAEMNPLQSPTQSRSRKLSARAAPLCLQNQVKPRVPRNMNLLAPDLLEILTSLRDGQLPWPLVLWGAPGGGKSSAALCLLDYAGGLYFEAEEFALYHNDVKFERVIEPFIWVEEGGHPPRHLKFDQLLTEAQMWASVKAAPLVVLDELGVKGEVKDTAYASLLRLLNAREFTPHVVISNVSMEALEAVGGPYDKRITSRLRAGTVKKINVPDRRQEGRI